MLNWLRTVGLLGLAKPWGCFVSVSGTIPGSLGPRNGIEVFVLPLVRGRSCSPFFFELGEGDVEGGQAGGREGGREGGRREGRETEGRERRK